MNDKPKRIVREKSYLPPFSGTVAQPVKQYRRIHERWIAQLKADLPDGVPLVDPLFRCKRCGVAVRAHKRIQEDSGKCGPITDTVIDDPWPATFGDVGEDGKPVHRNDGAGHCFQCGFCCYFVTLDASLGGDWGACTNPASQYDGRVTFEHWTCKASSWKGLSDQEYAAATRGAPSAAEGAS